MQEAIKRFRVRRAARLGIRTQERYDSVEQYRIRRAERMGIRLDADDDDGGEKGGHGNTKIPFGLCQREGIDIQKGWTPADAWKALEGKGYSASDTYTELKKTGKISGKPQKSKPAKKDYSAMSYEDLGAEYEDLVRRYQEAEKENDRRKKIAKRADTDATGAIKMKARGDYHGESYDQVCKKLDSLDINKDDDFSEYHRLSFIKRIMDNLGHDVFKLDDNGIIARAKKVEEEYSAGVSFGELNEERDNIRKARSEKAKQQFKRMTDCKTASDLEARVTSDDFFHASEWFSGQIDYQGMDDKSVAGVAKSMETIKKRFPKLNGMLRPPLMNDEVSFDAYAHCASGVGDPTVVLSKRMFTNGGGMMETIKNDVKNGFHPKGTASIQAIVTHEYGHAIDNILTKKFNRELNGMKFGEYVLNTIVQKHYGESHSTISEQVSKYAVRNSDEFLAEAFAEYCHSKSPGPIAMEVGRIVTEFVDRL